jgi:hypothetical protein
LSHLIVRGCGVVSPAGWGLAPFHQALTTKSEIPSKPITRPGSTHNCQGRAVPVPTPRPALLSHPRLRRASAISHYATAAAIEALGENLAAVQTGKERLGLVLCVTSGCVTYTRRFYDDVIKAPATASPLLFPETVFNAPASHIAAVLGTTSPSCTILGDQGTFLNGLGLAAEWLTSGIVDACVVVGAEELDWLRAYAIDLLDSKLVVSEGAGAICLTLSPNPSSGVEVGAISDPHLFIEGESRLGAISKARDQLGPLDAGAELFDGLQGSPKTDRDEAAVWADWTGPRCSPKLIFGEALMASSAWQCLAAIDAVSRGSRTAVVSVAGCNEQAIMGRFDRIQ